MDSDRWVRIDALFHAACERPPDEREAWLRAECGDDEALHEAVQALLQSDATQRDPVGGAIRDAVEELDDRALAEGSRVGRYRLIRELGRGGMGTVFLAERADGQFEQQVALKVIRRGLDTDEVLERFRRERQILARLEHPNIARLLDGGVTDDGRPFFAMEYVEGESIDVYCDRQGLDIDQRLALFLDVCRAVSHAHAGLVVHRDLKPANILVSEGGDVRLLDFGIAKLLSDEEGDEQTGLTEVDQRLLTPRYAAPEQVRGEAVTTATDVYALGIILYELLVGTPPHQTASRNLLELARVLTDTEPAKPSSRLLETLRAGETSIAETRRTDVRRLRRQLRGDLDVICLEALRPEPDRRYESVAALAEDIRRHRGGLPIRARPDTLGYRLRKGLVRHRVAVTVGAVVLIAVSGLIAFYTQRLADERDAARREATKAARVATFLQEVFQLADPSESRGQTVTARELLDEGARRIETGLAAEPDVQATMYRVVGLVYGSLGLADQARPLLERAVEGHRATYGDVHEETATSQLALAVALQDLGRVDQAEPLFEQALATRERLFPPGDERVREAIKHLAYLRETRGDYDEAERLYRDALARGGDMTDPFHLALLSKLGGLLRSLDRPAEAETLLRDALTAQTELHGERDLEVAGTARQLGALLRDLGEYDEAEAMLKSVLDVRRDLLGETHPEVLVTLNSYALLLQKRGDLDRAEVLLHEMAGTLEEVHDGPHPMMAVAYHNLAMAMGDVGRNDEAAGLFQRSIDVQDAVFDPDHPNRAFPRVSLGSIRVDQGRLDEAEPLLREALRVRRQALPPGHRYVGEAAGTLGRCLAEMGRNAEAEPLLLEAHGIYLAALGLEDRRTAELRRNLVRFYERQGKTEQADAFR